ncbi:RluA family pseudouridine synthase [Helicobacter sp. TUL]|uniref:RluA family pseudouridine synthase n=2 Tax=Helicobacter TaxID=209 RepID=UPI000BAB914B|nr:RluA family pseudouridine synthase [Helicobacter sp. TUL]PAU99752.1 RNA pseudouridine synthase [Helicobacter sp. TUL]
MQKAYKLLATQKNLSHNQAKALIDKGLVLVNGKKLTLARTELPQNTHFSIMEIPKPQVLFMNDELLAIDKPAFIESYDLQAYYQDDGWVLLHRLDKETSGVILLTKEASAFSKKAKEAFKRREVYKEYRAVVSGIIPESLSINKPISTIKKGFARSRIDKHGLEALTHIKPLGVVGKKTLLEVVIATGRTHQIRVHLSSINHPIVGDSVYGGISARRLLLHAHKIRLLQYEIISPLPKEFIL